MSVNLKVWIWIVENVSKNVAVDVCFPPDERQADLISSFKFAESVPPKIHCTNESGVAMPSQKHIVFGEGH